MKRKPFPTRGILIAAFVIALLVTSERIAVSLGGPPTGIGSIAATLIGALGAMALLGIIFGILHLTRFTYLGEQDVSSGLTLLLILLISGIIVGVDCLAFQKPGFMIGIMAPLTVLFGLPALLWASRSALDLVDFYADLLDLRRNRPDCPWCGRKMIPIVYGKPSRRGIRLQQLGFLALFGCMEGIEKWHCRPCRSPLPRFDPLESNRRHWQAIRKSGRPPVPRWKGQQGEPLW